MTAAAVGLTVLAACGGPDRLSKEEGRSLAAARERLDDALDTEEALRTSRAEARRIRRAVQRIVSDGSFEQTPLDEFGIARLGELREIAPSLVIADSRGDVRALDRRSTAPFLRFAERDPARALLRPASRQVSVMQHLLEEADAEKESEIPVVDATAEAYLREAARDVRAIWPALARDLDQAADEL
jgi:hypothetical protein